MVLYWLNFTSLLLTAILATFAIFSKHFDDNFLQRLGLVIIALTCFGRVNDLIDGTNAISNQPIAAAYVWKNMGVFLFAAGTFLKFTVRIYFAANLCKWYKDHMPYDRRKLNDSTSTPSSLP